MALSTVIGSSGSGKSTYLYKKIIEESIAHSDRNYLVIVPEQYTMSTQRLLVSMHPNHCIMNIDVLSFNRLAYRVFDELGLSVLGILDDTGKSLVLRKLVSDHFDELGALKKNMTRISYITQAKSLISEMTQYNITPEVLKEMINYGPMSESFRLKAKDLLVLYESFLEFIDGKYVTTESILSQLNACLDDSRMVAGSTIVLDGFTGFTPIQYQLLEHFLEICDEVYVSITSDISENLFEKKTEDALFEMSSDFMMRLNITARNAKADINEPILIDGTRGRLANNACLMHLEKNIFRSTYTKYKGEKDATEAISLATLKNPREELAYVAISINKLIRSGKYAYKDFAVVCPNLEQYRYILEGIWREYNIPFFVDSKTEILFHPFVEAIQAIFDIYEKNFQREDVFRFLRAGFTSLDRDEIDYLENYVISTGIRGKAKYFHPFAIRSNTFKLDEDLIRLNAIKDKFIQPFITLDKVLDGETTVNDIALGIYNLLIEFDCENKIRIRGQEHEESKRAVKAKEYSQIYKVVMDQMDKMVSILSNEKMKLDEFAEIFSAGLSAASIGVIPPANDSVIIGDMERTRLDNVKVLFLLGASDDAIPQKVENGGILSQLEREMLLEKFEMAPSDRQKAFRQRFYLYLMLTKPMEKLVVTAPRVDGAGKAARVSYLVETLSKMFDVKIDFIEDFSEEDRLLSNSGAMNLLIDLSRKIAHKGIDALSENERTVLMKLISWAKVNDELDFDSFMNNVFFEHEKEGISAAILLAINEAFNEDETVTGSVSKFETYSNCAYQYFLNYVLMLSEREKFELSNIDMGNFYHDALENYGKLLLEDKIAWAAVSEEQRSVYIDSAIRMTYEKMDKVATLEDPTQRYIVDSMKRTLLRTVEVITEQVKRGTFEPAYFEEKIEAIIYDNETNEQIAKLKGKVDRIDISDSESKSVRIVDYKSSAHKLDLDRVYYGLSLQLPIYMGVVLDKLRSKYKDIDIVPSAMLYYSTINPYIEGRNVDEALREKRLATTKMSGLLSDDEMELFANDKTVAPDTQAESSIVPYSVNKDGSVSKKSSVIPREGMDTLINYASFKASEIAKNIIEGEFDCKPNSLAGNNPCEFCGYKSVCHFNTSVAGFEINEFEKLGDAAIEQMAADLKKGDE